MGFLHMQNPLPLAQGLDQHLFWGAGHSCCRGWGPGFSQCPVSSPPDTPKPLAPFQGTVSSISPHGPLLINCSNSERKEERAQTLKPWELVNQELKFKTNALSCAVSPSPTPPRPVFFLFLCSFVKPRDPFRDQQHAFLAALHSLKGLQKRWGWAEGLITALPPVSFSRTGKALRSPPI